MTQLISKNPLVEKIIANDVNQEIYDLLFTKQLPFTDEEYLECLALLSADHRFESNALPLLRNIPESTKAQYSEKREANHQVVGYILSESMALGKPLVISKIIHNQALPAEYLMKIAEAGNSAILEMLLENQIKLIAYPEILDVMEKNPRITNFIKGKIQELREFYLMEERGAEIPKETIIEHIQEFAKPEEESAETEDQEVEIEEIHQKVITTLQRINQLSVPERIKLALNGTRTDRMILIKDPNKMVAMSVIESPKFAEDEVLAALRDRSIPQEVIARISNNREWSKNYTIILEMVQNPKTPLKTSLGLVKKLHVRDLKSVTYDKNVHYVVRGLATNLLKEKISKG